MPGHRDALRHISSSLVNRSGHKNQVLDVPARLCDRRAMLARTYIAIVAFSLAAIPTSMKAADRATLSASSLDGKPFSLSDERGKVVIINFWATWCAPCRAEMPALDKYYRAHRDEGLALLAISVDAGASTKKLAAVTRGFAFPVARLDDTRLARSAIPSALPETRIYGRDGGLRFDSQGRKGVPLDEATLQRVVAPLLAEPMPPTR